jgi:hypothetical protein
MAAKERKEHKENRMRELARSQRLHLNEDLKVSDRAARSGFLCVLSVPLRLNQLPDLG